MVISSSLKSGVPVKPINEAFGKALRKFIAKLTDFRKKHASLRPENFDSTTKFYMCNGHEADTNYLSNPANNFIAARTFEEDNSEDKSVYIAYNKWDQHLPRLLTLPSLKNGHHWYKVFDTSTKAENACQNTTTASEKTKMPDNEPFDIEPRSMVIMVER